MLFQRQLLLLAIGPKLNTENEGREGGGWGGGGGGGDDRGFVIPAPKLADPEIFSSVGRFFKPRDLFGTSPLFAFSSFSLRIYL